ncbi:hypothetical protein [Francisella uliginis]|uniref:Uncharacterized protein n=1 Tax=Francisella uliginis TaxID=573570 RepID=A0A1L4BU36_9GAMM|nr:hypothetical protein [Francisella uliginis]API87360.1 hypothetical protein F7310_08265 [Francisella uliginis]
MVRANKVFKITLLLMLSIQSYAAPNININPNRSVDSIIKSLQQEVSNLQIEAKNINKQDNKKQQPSFVMYNNVVVRNNPNENEYFN